MRRWLGLLVFAALAVGAGAVATGCGRSTTARGKDAGGDVAYGSGGVGGTGGLLGAGGATGLGGRVATGGGLGTGGTGAGGLMGTGGTKSGGATGTGGQVGTGGYVYVPAGVVGMGGGLTGGIVGTRTGGSAAGGSGGATGRGTGGATAMDASADIGKDGAGIDGSAAVIYSGCGYGGDIERAVVARFDAQAGVCVTLVLESPHKGPDASLDMTISPNWGVGALVLWPSTSANCATRNPPRDGRGASSASGSVTVNRTSGTIDIDAVFEFPATDGGAAQSVVMKAQGVDFMRGC